MRLVTLAVVTGIGIIIGVVMYLSQAVMSPTHEKQHITKVIGGEVLDGNATDTVVAPKSRVSEYDSMSPAEYNSKLPEAFRFGLQDSAGETNSSPELSPTKTVAVNADSTATASKVSVSSRNQSDTTIPQVAPDRFAAKTQIASLNSSASIAPMSPSESMRSDTPVMISPAMGAPSMALTAQTSIAPASKASVNHVTTANGTTVIPVDSPPITSHPNPHVSFETTQADGAERGRTKMVVNK
ncbi:hypothetical protein KF728_09035 [Candidatus Obscuribacterales bacterium]|nr:hypothetical protein [Candidatus Obscuribacterales bacterium]